MNRVRTFFVEEATECLEEIENELAEPSPNTETLYAAIRRLRGSAQVARFSSLAEDARPLEEALRRVAHGEMAWDDHIAERLAEESESLARGVEAVREGRMEQDEREPPMDDQQPEPGPALETVPAESLEYSGAAALDRAESLRGPLEDALAGDGPAAPLLDELFDLIRLGRK